MLKDFKEFLLKQNALALAIGIIIGVAIGKVVSAIVEDVINPVIGLLLPGGDWRAAKIVLAHGTDAAGKPTEIGITYGHLIGSVVDFVIIAFVVYMIGRAFMPKPAEGADDEGVPAVQGDHPDRRHAVQGLHPACRGIGRMRLGGCYFSCEVHRSCRRARSLQDCAPRGWLGNSREPPGGKR